MAAQAPPVPLTRLTRRSFALGATRRATARLLKSIHDVWDGSSFEPGRHSLTRVHPPEERQAPR